MRLISIALQKILIVLQNKKYNCYSNLQSNNNLTQDFGYLTFTFYAKGKDNIDFTEVLLSIGEHYFV